MRTKRILILLPLLLVAVLVQSAFWVPSYERQAAGNPDRLTTYVEASIGDAKILNPTISADAASSSVTGLVFEGLIDVDEDLNLIGGVATHWEISEEAYLVALPGRKLPDGAAATGAAIAARIRAAVEAGALPELAEALTAIEVLPAEKRAGHETLPQPGEGGQPKLVDVAFELDVPERLKLTLDRVDARLFERLEPLLGEGYFEAFDVGGRVRLEDPTQAELLRPHLGELLPPKEHNPALLFHLRRGVRFHDGHPFTAEDVVFTYQAIMDPKNLSPRTSSYEPVKAMEKVDDHTVRVVYKRLYSPAIFAWTMGILPKHLLDDAALEREMESRGLSEEARETFSMRNSDFSRHPIGTGPFRFVEWQPDEFIHLVRNEDWWKGRAEYKHVYMRVIPDTVTQEMEFRTGAVDYYGAEPHQVARYRADDRYQAISSVSAVYTYIGYNLRNPLFADRRVRRALGMALNVDEIIRYVLYGEGERSTGPYTQVTPYFDPDVAPPPYDPEKALALMAEAGWVRNAEGWLEKDGRLFEFKLITNNGNAQRKAIMTIAQNAWRRIGVRCNTQVFEWTVFLEDFVNALKFDAVILGWAGGGLDPDLYQIWHSSQTHPYQLNFVGYASEEADDLILRIREEYDPAEQRELARRLHALIAEDQPYTFLYVPRVTRILDKKIVIVERDPEAPGGERYVKIYPTKSGLITHYFDRWRKLAFVPEFEAAP